MTARHRLPALLFCLFCIPVVRHVKTAWAGETVLWRIGANDNKSDEFTGTSFPDSLDIPADWPTRTQWPQFPPHVDGSKKGKVDVAFGFDLDKAPVNGAIFRFKTINASSVVTELAVFANELPCGILQMLGTESFCPKEMRFGNTFSVYVPPDFLKPGRNTLRLTKLGQPYNRQNFSFTSFTWDYMELAAPDAPVADPVHSRPVHIGLAWGDFGASKPQFEAEEKAWEWTGIAYSGNPVRVLFWNDTWGDVTKPKTWGLVKEPLAYLQAIRQYHMRTIVDFANLGSHRKTGQTWTTTDGELTDHWKKQFDALFAGFGSYLDYYEICNEPCMGISDVPMSAALATAKYLKQTKPDHMKLAAPGWTFGGGRGEPENWDADVNNRKAIEAYCDAGNGHAYGDSYRKDHGGSFIENIRTYGKDGLTLDNGFPREMISTEMGTARHFHTDLREFAVEKQSHASIMDRIHRAYLGSFDLYCHFSFAMDPQCILMEGGKLLDPSTWISSDFKLPADPNLPREQTPMQILRRMVLAYSTHGSPLRYVYINPDQVKTQLVYFRAVDTSTLPLLSGETSVPKKILLSFVNFSDQPRRMGVRVTLPRPGVYTGVRIGADDSYLAARSVVALVASPSADIVETVGPLEAIGYTLEHDTTLAQVPPAPAAPCALTAKPGSIGKLAYVHLAWQPQAGAEQIKIQRSEDGVRFVQVDSIKGDGSSYDDASPAGPFRGKHYVYRLRAANRAGESAPSDPVSVETP
jgi:hypothetical protein